MADLLHIWGGCYDYDDDDADTDDMTNVLISHLPSPISLISHLSSLISVMGETPPQQPEGRQGRPAGSTGRFGWVAVVYLDRGA